MDKNSLYNFNKKAKVGEEIVCPVCGEKFIKKQYSQAFCCGRCKDRYHNRRKGNRYKTTTPQYTMSKSEKRRYRYSFDAMVERAKAGRLSDWDMIRFVDGYTNMDTFRRDVDYLDKLREKAREEREREYRDYVEACLRLDYEGR